jgi:hypothetical protein
MSINTPNLGFGQFTFGEFVYGFGNPATAIILDGVLLEDATGNVQECPYIDPNTGNYDIDANGQVVGSSTISNSVYLAIATTLGTTPLPSLGSTFFQLKTIGGNVVSQVQNIIYQALSTYVQSNQISIASVDVFVQPKGSSLQVNVSWIDNTSGNLNNTVVS